jgi:serine/threonine protein kinase/lipopolysaccharide biosynthesis regulator YciM
MPLNPGTKLGPYEIQSLLGAGGMGEVYRARDARLEREVALKLLPMGALGDETAQARLIEEAKTASALNHPHICTIYEVGEADGKTYVAMEYVEGQPLGQQIPHDGLPFELVLRYGGQIADALAYAHEHGIVHRDLKSANVMITPDGRAKVLDFGLARRISGSELSEATLSKKALCEDGEIAGTLQYMAPEVLRGEATDARSDVWALGVLLYEMAAGWLPFGGKTAYELTSAILREPTGALPPVVPAGLRSVIQRCLAKEAGHRYSHIGEVRSALEAIGSSETVSSKRTVRADDNAPRWRASRIAAVAGIFVAVALLTFAMRGRFPGSASRPSKLGEATASAGPRLSTGGKASASKEANEYFERAMLFEAGRFDPKRSQEFLAKALELDPHFAEARASYAQTFWEMVDSGFSNDNAMLYKAEEEVRRALQDDPSCGRAHTILGWLHYYGGLKAEAKAEAERAIQLNAHDLDAQYLLANYYELSGESDRAMQLVEKGLQESPTSWFLRMQVGWILSDKGDQAGAIREYEKVLEQDPQNPDLLGNLGYAQVRAGNAAAARKALERAKPKDRTNFWLRLVWAQIFALEGNRNAALKEMDSELLKYAALTPFSPLLVAEFYALLRERKAALDWLEKALRLGDERAETFLIDPLLASIHEESRFNQILESIAFRRQQREKMHASP